MLAPASDAIRLSLHVLAATIWVGGQFTLAGLVPTLRASAPAAVRPAARRFAQLAWPAYVVLVGTGIWNVVAEHPSRQGGPWNAVLGVKIGVVVLAGVAAYGHQRAQRVAALAIWGSLAALASITAVVLGILLAG